MIWAISGLFLLLAVLVPTGQGLLHQRANRVRVSCDARPEAEPARLRTEQERWEDTFDMRAPQEVFVTELQIEADGHALDRVERVLHAGLDELWDEVRRVCELDEWDEAWCALDAQLAADLVAA